MDINLYQRETALIASEQSGLLDEASQRLAAGERLSRLEMNGVLHALQVLSENAIGKAKHILNIQGEAVPVSAYDSFSALAACGMIRLERLDEWQAVIGLRNRIVHDYMNIDLNLIQQLVMERRYQFVTEFLMAPIVSRVEIVNMMADGK